MQDPCQFAIMKRQMKKIFSFLIIVSLWCTVSRPAAAQTPTPTPDPCSPDAPLSTPCPVRYDTTNTVIPRNKTWVSSLVDSIAKLLGKQMMAEFNWTGSLRPSGDQYHIGSEKLTTYGLQIKESSETDLKPAALQDITKPDEQQKLFTMTSVVCTQDPQTGAITQISSSDRIESKDIPGLTQAIEGSRQLGSYVAGYTQVSQDYNLKNVVVATDAVACESLSTGQPIQQAAVTTQNQNSYTGKNNVLVTIIAAMIAPFQGMFRAQVTETAEIQGKGLTPWIHYPLCLFAGCKTQDTASVSYDTDENKKQLTQAGGAVAAMYKPAGIDDAYKSDLNAADPSQEWSITGAGDQNGQVAATAVNYAQARVTGAGDYMNCTLMPADYQNTAVPDGACNTNWVGSADTSGGWNCNTNVGEQSVTGLNAQAGQSYANRLYGSCTSGTENAWEQCKDDVIARAKKACVDPLFALAIWLHESGASNYVCGKQLSGGKVQDFGVNIPSIAENFSEQLDRFLQLPGAYAARCPTKTLKDFVAVYWIGNGCYNQLSSSNKAKIDGYIGELQLIYSTIAPGVKLPTWPASGC